jgi:hypothetical protein
MVAMTLMAPPLVAQQHPEHDAVVAVVKRLFDGMRAGDSAIVRSTFADGAVMATATLRDGQPVWRFDPGAVDGFTKAVGTPHEQVWDEKLWDVDVMIDMNLATVWTRYAFFAGTQFSHCGVDTITLAKNASGWKIIFLADTRQREGCDLPSTYEM